ncbi:Borealin N terminal-domain-containing protein [Xylogone sp. PMI_703]|nr:Borealin N terminal-domain-containing protein [Xylogone sp. PMI_703]
MAPTRTRKRKSNESTASVDTQTFPMAPPQLVPTKARSPARTPPSNRSPIRRSTAGITLAQKQALIDNLQLEITERARKLRAQYALQAQGLRTRIEIRVNRIPMSLRKVKMEELVKKYGDTSAKTVVSNTVAPKQPAKVAPRTVLGESKGSRQSPAPPQRGTKRLSDALSTDKENEGIENPKKRTRAPPAVRPPSRALQSSRVLSPKSSNSRAPPPQSPVRPALTSQRPNFARPVSPMKPPASIPGRSGALSSMAEPAKSTRTTGTTKSTGARSVAGSVRGRKPAITATRSVRTASNASDTSHGSNGTTIVRKPITTKKEPVKKPMGSVRGTGTTTAKKAASERGTISRTLRKRN